MTSERQFGLFPESDDQLGSSLHGFEAVTGELADFADGVQALIGDLVLLEVRPDRLDGIELGRIGQQARYGDMSVLFFEPSFDEARAMGGDAIPNNQQRPFDLALKGAKKLDDLLGADGASEEAEIELPEGQPGDCRHLFPGETVLQHGRMSAQAPGARNARALAQSGFVDEDDGAGFSLRSF